jgi:catechol 2,3-dioxygenase-like lactoylglutathione lyase family enzyme
MTKVDAIIAVKDVEASAEWYEAVLGCKRTHGGEDFATLASDDNEILLCLHRWGSHGHPTMTDPVLTAGNGLILYFRTQNMSAIREKVKNLGVTVEEDVHLNPNSLKQEFSLRDPDGYYLTITEFHTYEG